MVSLTRFRSKTDDLMENSRGKRCALDIQDYSQVDKLDVHLSYFLDIKSLTDFLKRENTKRIIYFFLLTQAFSVQENYGMGLLFNSSKTGGLV